jgi:hypothetical protein
MGGREEKFDSMRVQLPSSMTRSEQDSLQTLSSHLQSGAEEERGEVAMITSPPSPSLPPAQKLESQSPQFLRPKVDSDSSVPPTRRRHQRRSHRNENGNVSGYSTNSQSLQTFSVYGNPHFVLLHSPSSPSPSSPSTAIFPLLLSS